MAETVPFKDLSLFPATREQVIESRKRTSVQWSRGQSLEEYLRRDEIMDKDVHAANDKLITWVLARRDDPTGLDFMCSCETYRRTALVSPRGASEVTEVTGYGVASVYTPPQNRKRGYARHMMRLLHWVLRPRTPAVDALFPPAWGAPPAVAGLPVADARFSVLYSDVGPDFYHASGPTPDVARGGWAVLGARETSLTIAPMPTSAAEREGAPPAGLCRLSEADVLALYEHDARWVRADLARIAAAAPHRTQFSFLPDVGVGAFVVRRTMDFARDAAGALQPVLPTAQWGVAVLPPGARALADALVEGAPEVHFVTWTLEKAAPRALVVARTRADERTFPGLLEELVRVAREEKCEKVEFWYLPDDLRAVAEAHGWTTIDRHEHLSAVKWYGPEAQDELDWIYNEKFCWC